jgi:non-heme chloroperoxidase
VGIAIQESGNPDGPEILFIHGFLGSHLSWLCQADSPEMQRYRMITYDLRGHGLSDKPSEATFYTEGKRFGDEVHTIIQAAQLKRPVLAGWSLAGAALINYLETYGDSAIAGVAYVDGVIETRPELMSSHPIAFKPIASDGLREHLEGTGQIEERCFFRRPEQKLFELLYANAALATSAMSYAISKVSSPARTALPRVTKPVLLLYGDRDDLLNPHAQVAFSKQLIPGATAVIYQNVGQAPFVEAPQRFNDELMRFVQAAQA